MISLIRALINERKVRRTSNLVKVGNMLSAFTDQHGKPEDHSHKSTSLRLFIHQEPQQLRKLIFTIKIKVAQFFDSQCKLLLLCVVLVVAACYLDHL